mmetsp:Transcript_127826/g.310784  ORF Transcript_127826/g.310784 Transcript_127826/m.310784 type:complete len:365 (+) Transcript_127826:78-1172(+)
MAWVCSQPISSHMRWSEHVNLPRLAGRECCSSRHVPRTGERALTADIGHCLAFSSRLGLATVGLVAAKFAYTRGARTRGRCQLRCRDTGLDPAPYLDDRHELVITAEHCERLLDSGYVVVDGALDSETVATLAQGFDVLEQLGVLQTTPEAAVGIRDDAIYWQTEVEAMPCVSEAISLLKGVAEVLNERFGALYDKEPHSPIPPATVHRPLTVPATAMLASYAPGGRYRIHSDNSLGEDGQRRNWRELTAILYANQDWDTGGNEGHLRLWPHSEYVDPYQHGRTDAGEARLRETLRETWPRRCGGGLAEQASEGAEFVDVAPLGGRLVIFKSCLLHEVQPSRDRPRRAVTVWIYRPARGGEVGS